MFKPQPPVSAYLVKPSVKRRQASPWNGFRTQYYEIRRYNPRLAQNTIAILFVWVAVMATLQGVMRVTPAANSQSFNLPAVSSGVASRADTNTPMPAPAIANAVHVSVLPGGPSGQLLPPGTMAADHAYANNYAWGQCTWYVAGRRQIPPNWGNAASWYYHAAASGWSVGTVPAVAAVAWTPAGYYGHVALVEQVSADGRQVYVSEMNYRGLDVKSYRWAPASSFKYIY